MSSRYSQGSALPKSLTKRRQTPDDNAGTAALLRMLGAAAPAVGTGVGTAIGAGIGGMAGGVGAAPGAMIGGGIGGAAGSAIGGALGYGADEASRPADEEEMRKRARLEAVLGMLGRA